MADLLFPEGGGWTFILLTIALGGLGGFATGRAVAKTWRSFGRLAIYMLPFAAAIRFLHYALFQEPLLDPRHYLVTLVVVVAFAWLGWRRMRAQQMTRQYSWRYTPSGPLGWTEKTGA